jgi:hypothetical protein
MLPGLAATAAWAVPAFVFQHYALARKFRSVTREQTDELKAHLSGEGGAGSDGR